MPNIAENKTYKWTTTQGSYLDEVPRIFAKTYKLDDNEALNTVSNWFRQVSTSQTYKQFYDKLHKASKKDEWVFPYFDDGVRGFSNDWGSNMVTSLGGGNMFGLDLASGVKAFGDKVMNSFGGLQQLLSLPAENISGSLFEPPKFYQYGVTDGPVTVEFTLINTESEEDFSNNYDLVSKLIADNRFTRRSGLLTEAPVLWSVTIPGYRAIRWASCDVNVSLLGKRAMKDNKIAPEGYKVALTFKSLYTEPSNFMNDATQGGSL
jgi:hypothetical protein